jgi:arylsulfatase
MQTKFKQWCARVLLAAVPVAACAGGAPNIIVILADDLGFSDVGCYGSEIDTPNIDRLAANGVRFTQFYNTARCNPSRAALLTGLHPQRSGMAWIPENLGLPAYLGHLNAQCVTIPEVLKPAGYTTLMSGKWHVGIEEGQWPLDRGFDRFFGLVGGAGSYWEVLPGEDFKMALDGDLWRPDPGDKSYYFTDAVTDRAIEFVSTATKRTNPFFLYLAYTAPHWPLHAPEKEIAKYRGRYREGWDAIRESRYRRQIKLGIIDKKWALSPRDSAIPAWETVSPADQDQWDLRMAVYAAMIDRMDQGIGRLLGELERAGKLDNTLVIFLSDNGGCGIDPPRTTAGSDPNIPPGPQGGYWGYGEPWANVSNTPFRKFKQFIHEGGIATPLICSWPVGIRAQNGLNHQPGHIVDIMPTLMEVAGASYPQERNGEKIHVLEGSSFASVFRGEVRPEHEVICWEHTGNQGVRMGDWKLVAVRNAKAGWELYNLKEDRSEMNDLAGQYPDRVADMSRRYEKWAADSGLISFDDARRLRDQKRRERKQ